MTEKIPAEIRAQLDDFLTQIHRHLPNLFEGIYLFGSIALGNFHREKSDIDFVGLLNRPCDEHDIQVLQSIHQDIAKRYPKYQMDGSYLQKSDVGKLNDALNPYPYFDGEMHAAGHYDINMVTWWILKHHGITLLGDDIQSLPFSVDWDALIGAVHENLNSYWYDWAHHPKRAVFLLSDWAIEWAVLGVLRLYYSFQENDITSKTGAGDYALLHLADAWHPLIQHALALRDNQATSYKNPLSRQQDTQKFLRYVIDACNQMFGE